MEGQRAVWWAGIAIACLLFECLCFSLEIDTRYQQVVPGRTFRFVCQANLPLAQCQARDVYAGRVFDLTEKDRSTGYWGTGLKDGQCGFAVKMTDGSGSNLGVGIPLQVGYPYGCRARAFGGDWEYATTVMELSGPSGLGVLPVMMGPRTVFSDPGGQVIVTLAADGQPLQRCRFTWPGTFWVANGTTSSYAIDNADLARGRCRLKLLNVTPNMAGVIVSFAEALPSQGTIRHFMQTTTLIVKMAPGVPALSFNKADGVYNDGDVLEASCHVGVARPLARITWLLNDDVIQGDPEEFSKMPWEFEAGDSTRKLKRKLSMADDGKVLVCRVHHIALPRGVIEKRSKIRVLRTFEIPSRIADLGPAVHATPSSEGSAPLGSARTTWLLIDVGSCLLVVTVMVVALLVCARATGRRFLARPCDQHPVMKAQGKDVSRESNIYDDVLDLESAPSKKKNVSRDSSVYDDVMELASAPSKSHGNSADAIYDDVGTAQFAYSGFGVR